MCAPLSTPTAPCLAVEFLAGTRAGVGVHLSSAVVGCSLAIVLGMTHKNIERLFPVDQSMVVIIDDRADVWDTHQNNLVKVIPCTSFIPDL